MKSLKGKDYVLGVQHLFAMFGATVLVPMLTGLNPGIALLSAGIGTLLFHLITGGQVPVFLGSSFAFIPAIVMVMNGGIADGPLLGENIPLVQGGIIVAGLVYVVISLVVKLVGAEKVKSFFPPIVTGPVIVVIGLSLSGSAISSASECWPLAIIVIISIVITMCFTKGFFKLVPILIGIVVGYLVALISDVTGLTAAWGLVESGKFISFTSIQEAGWFFDFTALKLPVFDLSAILTIAPIAFVTFMEHIGDITTNGAVVGKDFFKQPGLHRTLLGDGIATAMAGLIGAPANTTYGENTGVLAVTKNYNPAVLRLAACFAIILGLFPKVGAILQTLPGAAMGGVSIILFGMIASVGLRTLAESNLDFSHSRNLIIIAIILVLGLGLSAGVDVSWIFGGAVNINLSGIFIATLVGVIANKVLPKDV